MIEYDSEKQKLYWKISKLEVELQRYKDIEEKIGVDLITLFEAFNGIYYIKDGEIKFSCHIAIVDWKIYILEESFEIDAKKGFCVGLNEYGKTWALEEEELKK